jgi:hypothetical protein
LEVESELCDQNAKCFLIVGRFDIQRKTLGKTPKIALSIIIVLLLSTQEGNFKRKRKLSNPV